MLTVGKYPYPEKVTFSEALNIAKLAIDKYDGKISNKNLAEALGYKIKDRYSISGYIFRKFDDICSYNLMKRERGYVEVTSIAKEAVHPFDSRKSQEGKTKAIRQMGIVKKAFTEWNGEIPSETALSPKLMKLLEISWQEAEKHAKRLRKLFIEVFPYLRSTPTSTKHRDISVSDEGGGRDIVVGEKKVFDTPIGVSDELRIEQFGILKIKDEVSIDIAIKMLQTLKDRLSVAKQKKKEKQPD